jgi:hypothetical protein
MPRTRTIPQEPARGRVPGRLSEKAAGDCGFLCGDRLPA